MILRFFDKYRDTGLLILRLGLGTMFIMHGGMKLLDGPEVWADIGNKGMKWLSISSFPQFWGFMAGASEFLGGVAFLAGFFFRPACIALFVTMIFATISHFFMQKPAQFFGYSHPIEDGIVFFSFILIGPGRFSLDELLGKRFFNKPAETK